MDCPGCGERLELVAPASATIRVEAPDPPRFTYEEAVGGIVGKLRRPWTSPLYLAALVVAGLVMLLLPVVYLLMIGSAAWGTWWWGTHMTFLVTSFRGGIYLMLLKGTLYSAPLLAGAILVLFMIKPLFARPGQRAQPLALNPAAEPVLYAFVERVCDLVGAPRPSRIDLDCQLNAAAGFRGGLGSLLAGNLVLTLGLPLVAGLSAREFAGVVAHEFGHFRQGLGMRLSYLIRSVNAWFARVIYERDAWDQGLDEWLQDAQGFWAVTVGFCSAAAVGVSRFLLWLLMWIGHLFCAFLMRQMEYDADRCQIRLAGSAAFESMIQRVHLLGYTVRKLYQELQARWRTEHQLPDSLPAMLTWRASQLPSHLRTQLQDTLGLTSTRWFHTHPSAGDRIREARRAQEPGLVTLEGPASALLNNFDIVARQVTFLHYTDDLGLPAVASAVVPVATLKARQTSESSGR